MKILDKAGVLSVMCKLFEKYGMYISFVDDDEPLEVCKAAPYLDFDEHHQVFIDSCAWLLFDTEEDMLECYERTVGDDGPTKLNLYTGEARVYAITCSPTGELWNENT